jgi:hypothetical protein
VERLYLALIFLTGAITLAMELLASRILTPYFGVSLFIWSGILSITLIALALGYYLGGQFTRTPPSARTHSLEFLFLLMPTLAGSMVVASCLLYPKVFHLLGSASLVFGAYAACVLLIFFPLVAVSTMNPLLIAIKMERAASGTSGSDSGSGLVFFVSTVGSVVGVSLTAFVLIPSLTNFSSMLLLASTLSVVSGFGAWRNAGLPAPERTRLFAAAAFGIVAAFALLAFASTYLKKDVPIDFGGGQWTLEREYTSYFGNTKILKIAPDPNSPEAETVERYGTLYYNDGITMNIVDAQGASLTPFTWALEFLARGLRPKAERALMLGLGAGIIPMRLEAVGVEVDVVEVNPSSVEAAVDHFGFDDERVNVVVADARTFVRECPKPYDVVLLDMSNGDGLPEHLVSLEFFSDVRRCLTPDGITIFNTFGATEHLEDLDHVFKTLHTVFPHLRMYHDGLEDGKPSISIYLAAFQREETAPLVWPNDPVPPGIAPTLEKVFSQERPIDYTRLERAEILRDEFNRFSILNQASDEFFRESILLTLPPEFLVN